MARRASSANTKSCSDPKVRPVFLPDHLGIRWIRAVSRDVDLARLSQHDELETKCGAGFPGIDRSRH